MVAMSTIDQIINAVVGEYQGDKARRRTTAHGEDRDPGISAKTLIGPRRFGRLAEARQVAMYLARQLTTKSYPQIGHILGNRDHTTIMHGAKAIATGIMGDPNLKERVVRIETRIRELDGAA